MKRIVKTGLFILFLTLSTVVFPQSDLGFINGVLLDSGTKEPVVFATIRVLGWSLGVISNNDGSFQVPTDFKLKGDTLVISSMGYETKKVDFADLMENNINQIFIKPYAFQLSETVVVAKKKRKRLDKAKVERSLSAKQIIRYAIERIPDNYNKNPFELVGYYRDYQLREKEYINLNEALIRVLDSGFEVKGYSSLQFALYNYESNLNFEQDSLAAKPYDYKAKDKYIPNTQFTNKIVPNELMLLFNHDAIRHNNELSYSFVDIFVKDFIRKHDFFTYFLTNYGDKEVYKIKFAKSLSNFEVKGDIYIDADTYAIRKLDYAVYQQSLDEASASIPEVDLLYEILVEYKEHEGHMYLNYISFHNKFKLVRPPKFYLKDIIRKLDSRGMLIVLNKPAKNWYDLKPKDIILYYGESRLKVNGLRQVDATTYKLELSKKTKSQRKKGRQFFRQLGTKKEEPIIFDINNMIDFEGNLLGEENSELLNQFREFFTQRIISVENKEDVTTSYVDKTISLNHPEQLKTKMKADEEFWMNTPLKN
ncbi:unnamed protein product, partial [Ectocarpus sp. 12 AP-2014]